MLALAWLMGTIQKNRDIINVINNCAKVKHE